MEEQVRRLQAKQFEEKGENTADSFHHRAPCVPGQGQAGWRARLGCGFALAALLLLGGILSGCDTIRPVLYRVDVTPAVFTQASSPQNAVAFTATGVFGYGTERTLDSADGLTWSSSNPTVGIIGNTGIASCNAPGAVTITATAPANLVSGSTPVVSGTATLTCS